MTAAGYEWDDPWEDDENAGKLSGPSPELLAFLERARAAREQQQASKRTGAAPSEDHLAPASKPASGRDGATQLVDLALDRYDIRQNEAGLSIAVPREGPRIVRTLRDVRGELARAFYREHDRAPSEKDVSAAMRVLEGEAASNGRTPLALRVAEADGAQWLDLGDDTGRVVRVAPDGWSVEREAPVLFRRTALTAPLPTPVPGGSLDELWRHVNVAEEDRPVVLAGQVAALLPTIPHPVTFITGEQGAGKSTGTRALTSVVDPSTVPLRKPPKDVEAWTLAAGGSYGVAVDNVSHIPPWWSDSLCRAATGDGDVRRALYTDDGLHVFAFRRVVFVNGIDLTGIRDDLADRAVTIRLEPLVGRRRTDAELASQWEDAHPRILAALLDLAVDVLGELPTVRLDDPPRMIDFARVLAAVDSVLGTTGLDRYVHLADDLAADAVSSDPVLSAITTKVRAPWEGTAAELLTLLDAGEWLLDTRPREWPRDARSMTTVLRRRGPSLRHLGWSVDDLGRGGKAKAVRWRIVPPASEGLS